MAENRARVLRAITSPLAFIGLLVLAIEAIVITVVINQGSLTQAATAWVVFIGIGVLVIVLAVVIVLTWRKPKNLTYGPIDHLIEGDKMPFGTDSDPIRPEQRFDSPRGERPES